MTRILAVLLLVASTGALACPGLGIEDGSTLRGTEWSAVWAPVDGADRYYLRITDTITGAKWGPDVTRKTKAKIVGLPDDGRPLTVSCQYRISGTWTPHRYRVSAFDTAAGQIDQESLDAIKDTNTTINNLAILVVSGITVGLLFMGFNSGMHR